MSKKNISVKVNGTEHGVEVEPRLLLVHLIREVLNLTGTHIGAIHQIVGRVRSC